MKSVKNSIPILLLLVLSSCASKYAQNPHSLFNHYGYDAVPLDSNTYQVSFTGNGLTSTDVASRYALYRAAEVTVDKGYDYFVVVDGLATLATITSVSNGAPITSTTSTPGIDPMSGKMVNTTTTTTTQTQNISTANEPTITKSIRMYKGSRPADNPSAYDAKSMLNLMGPYIDR